jgi:hypothetical protein
MLLVLFFLTVYRLSRFIGQDTFPPIAYVRSWLIRNKPEGHWLIYLIGNNQDTGCPWCISLWLGAAGSVGLGFAMHWQWWICIMIASASSAVTGLMSQLEN